MKVETGADEAVIGFSVLPLVDAGAGDVGGGVVVGSKVGASVLAGETDETFSVGPGATVVDGMDVVETAVVDAVGVGVGGSDEGAAVRGLVAGSAVVALSTGLTVLMGVFVFVFGV